MAYDEHSADDNPGPIATPESVARSAGEYLRRAPAEKLVLAIGAYGYDWPLDSDGDTARPGEELSYAQALVLARENEVPIEWDARARGPFFAYEGDAGAWGRRRTRRLRPVPVRVDPGTQGRQTARKSDAHLRRRARPRLDAAHPRPARAARCARGLLRHRRQRTSAHRSGAPGVRRRAHGRQPHLHAPGPLARVSAPHGGGAERHREAARVDHWAAPAALPAALPLRPGARRGPERAGHRARVGHGLSHARTGHRPRGLLVARPAGGRPEGAGQGARRQRDTA